MIKTLYRKQWFTLDLKSLFEQQSALLGTMSYREDTVAATIAEDPPSPLVAPCSRRSLSLTRVGAP